MKKRSTTFGEPVGDNKVCKIVDRNGARRKMTGAEEYLAPACVGSYPSGTAGSQTENSRAAVVKIDVQHKAHNGERFTHRV